nr:hypothetical protein [Halomonas sp. KX33721]
MLWYSESLAFGRGLSNVDEPALWESPSLPSHTAGSCCLPAFENCRRLHYHNFGALSHGLPTRCVRFAAAVTRHHATLAAGWWLALAGWDFHPLGFTTSFPPSRFPGCPGFAWRTQILCMAGQAAVLSD